jgi:hypothetical protein
VAKNDNESRSTPNSTGAKATKPFLIKI